MKLTEELKLAIKHAPFTDVKILKDSVLKDISIANVSIKLNSVMAGLTILAISTCIWALVFPGGNSLFFVLFFSALLASNVLVLWKEILEIWKTKKDLDYFLKVLSWIILREEEEKRNVS